MALQVVTIHCEPQNFLLLNKLKIFNSILAELGKFHETFKLC